MPNQAAVQSAMTRKWDSKRTITTTGRPVVELKRSAGITRKLVFEGGIIDRLSKALSFPRFIVETLRIQDGPQVFRDLARNISTLVHSTGMAGGGAGFIRKAAQTAGIESTVKRHPVFTRNIVETPGIADGPAYSVVWLRRLEERKGAADTLSSWGSYIRGLYTAAGSMAETLHTGEYYRKKTETVGAEGAALRRLCIFIRLVTVGLVRDFLIGRFLKAREEIILKSPVCREIAIESRIH
jgi:hypothetical protein